MHRTKEIQHPKLIIRQFDDMTIIPLSLSRSFTFLNILRQYFGEISDGQTNEITFAFGELIGKL